MNQVEALSIVIRVAGHAIFAGRAFGEETGVISAMLRHSLCNLSVTIETFELRASERNCMALCAMGRAFKETVRLRQRSRGDLRLRN